MTEDFPTYNLLEQDPFASEDTNVRLLERITWGGQLPDHFFYAVINFFNF